MEIRLYACAKRWKMTLKDQRDPVREGKPPNYGLAKVHKANKANKPLGTVPGSSYYKIAKQVAEWLSVVEECQINSSKQARFFKNRCVRRWRAFGEFWYLLHICLFTQLFLSTRRFHIVLEAFLAIKRDIHWTCDCMQLVLILIHGDSTVRQKDSMERSPAPNLF